MHFFSVDKELLIFGLDVVSLYLLFSGQDVFIHFLIFLLGLFKIQA